MSKIIGLAGVRGAGRTTFRNFVYHKMLKSEGIECWLREDGYIGVPVDEETSAAVDPDGALASSPLMVEKVYPNFHSFALWDSLKFFATQFYGLSPDRLYGNEDDLQSLTAYTIGDLYTKAPATRPLKQAISHLEFLEKLESNLLKINPSALHNALGNTLIGEESKTIMVTDLKSQADIDFINSFENSFVYRLSRNPYNLPDPFGKVPDSDFTEVFYNDEMKMSEFHDKLFNTIIKDGALD